MTAAIILFAGVLALISLLLIINFMTGLEAEQRETYTPLADFRRRRLLQDMRVRAAMRRTEREEEAEPGRHQPDPELAAVARRLTAGIEPPANPRADFGALAERLRRELGF